MEHTRHIYLSSRDPAFPENSPSNFRCLLPERMQLSGANWWCCLLELRIPENISEPLYLCSDACLESIVGQKKLPVLGMIGGKITQPNHVTYIPVKVKDISIIRLYICDSLGHPVSFSSGTSYCSIRFCNDEAPCYHA